MRNMSTSLKKLTEYQKTYDFYVAQGKKDSEEALDALAELQDEQYNFVGFAESLASAFDMSENGKQAMMQLGYTISKNWKPIYNGFNQVWKKVNPAFAENLTNLIGLYSREGASETMAATMNAVVSAMRGDWASAVASGLTAVLDIVGTDFGRTLSEAIGNALRSAFSGNGLFAQLLSNLLGGITPGGSGGGGFFSKAWDFIKRLLGRKSTGVAGGGSGDLKMAQRREECSGPWKSSKGRHRPGAGTEQRGDCHRQCGLRCDHRCQGCGSRQGCCHRCPELPPRELWPRWAWVLPRWPPASALTDCWWVPVLQVRPW